MWWGLRASADGAAPGYPVVVFGGRHADVDLDEGMGEALGRLVGTHPLLACVVDLSELGGSAARLVGKAFHNALEQWHPSLERGLREKGNAAITRAAESREVRVSLSRVFNAALGMVHTGRSTGRPFSLTNDVGSHSWLPLASVTGAPSQRNRSGLLRNVRFCVPAEAPVTSIHWHSMPALY